MSIQPNSTVSQPVKSKSNYYTPLAIGTTIASTIGAGYVGYSRDISVNKLKDTFIKAAKDNIKEESEYESLGFKQEIDEALAIGHKENAEYCIKKTKEICTDKWRTKKANELFEDIKHSSQNTSGCRFKNSHKNFLKIINYKLDYYKIIKPMESSPKLGNCCYSSHFYNMPIDIGIKHYEHLKNSVEKFVRENLTKCKLQKAGIYGGLTAIAVGTAAYLLKPKPHKTQED